MSGFVTDLSNRFESISRVSEVLRFPWDLSFSYKEVHTSLGNIVAKDIFSTVISPPYTRSLRDGYAVQSEDISGASSSSPVYLKLVGEIPMGQLPFRSLYAGEAMIIHTGGILPEGADSVVMLEYTAESGPWVEVRKAAQQGEHVIFKGEELRTGEKVLSRGDLVSFKNLGILATMGQISVPCLELRIGILSTGDEIVDISSPNLSPGCIRDVNSWSLWGLLSVHGFHVSRLGIIKDKKGDLEKAIHEALNSFDVLLVSGGSSVSVRDYCSEILETLPDPGLIVRGVRMSPGKPVLIAGSLQERKLVMGIPGHPLSCMVAAKVLLLPLLNRLIGTQIKQSSFLLETTTDIIGSTGIEKFYPAILTNSSVAPLSAKSGYVGILKESSGLIRLDESVETVRQGEKVEFIPW